MRFPESVLAALPLPRMLMLPVLALTLVGCPSEPEPEPNPHPDAVDLAKPDLWTRVTDVSVDAFADLRPADAICDDAGYVYDPYRQSIEIETEVCDYLTLQQPTLVDLEPGDVVSVLGYHDVLTAPDPAQGYLGLAFAGEVEWELSVPIPSDAAIFEEQFSIDRSIPAGTDMQFHVHNHGPNTWELVSVLATPADAE